MSPPTETISVIIPCHNYGRFVEEAVRSVDAQTRPVDQIVICDDGSSDDSWGTIQRLAAERSNVATIRHEHAWGLVATLNQLWRTSEGRLIVPLSADDRLGPGYLDAMAAAVFDQGWDFAYTDMQCFGSENWRFIAPEFDIDRLARFNYIHGSSGLTRDCLEAVGGYQPTFERGFEDYDFWLSVLEHGFEGGKAEGVHLEYRRHEQGSRNTASISDRLRLRYKLFRHHPRFFLHPRTLRAWLPSNRPIAGVEAPP